MSLTTWYDLKVRGDGLQPGDFIEKWDTVALHVRVHLGTVNILLEKDSPNGNRNVSVSSDQILTIQRPITTRGVKEGFVTLP